MHKIPCQSCCGLTNMGDAHHFSLCSISVLFDFTKNLLVGSIKAWCLQHKTNVMCMCVGVCIGVCVCVVYLHTQDPQVRV